MSEAVYAAGFGSYAQFYKVFTQAYGRGPRACLRQKAEGPMLKRPSDAGWSMAAISDENV